MKLVKLFALIYCFAAFAASAQAQSEGDAVYEIPFDFVVRKQTLPAGAYKFERLDKGNPNILVLRNTDGRRRMILLAYTTFSKRTKDRPVLSFIKIGDRYFLSEIRSSDSDYGNRLLPESPEGKRRVIEAKLRIIRSNKN
jgi:hypothetical protein